MPILANTNPNMTREMMRKNRFLLITSQDDNWFAQNLLEVSVPDITFVAAEWWDGTAIRRIMTDGTFSSITMSFYLPLDSHPLYKWISEHMAHTSDPNQAARINVSTEYKRNFLLMFLDGKYNPLSTWSFIGCQILRVSHSQPTQLAEGAVMTASIEIAADRVLTPEQTQPLGGISGLLSDLANLTGSSQLANLTNMVNIFGSTAVGAGGQISSGAGQIGSIFSQVGNLGSTISASGNNMLNVFSSTYDSLYQTVTNSATSISLNGSGTSTNSPQINTTSIIGSGLLPNVTGV